MIKAVVLFGLISTISDVFGSPVTSEPSTRTPQKWQMVPDGEGRMHLIDVTAPVEEIEPMFNAEADTIFNLHTRTNPNGQRITWSLGSIQGSTFSPSHPVRFLIHGWNSDYSSGINVASTKSYLDMGDFNVIVVDWGAGAGTINYATARDRVPEVADIIAKLIDFLVENGLARTSNIIIAGHSLGGHIAGLTGKRTKNSSGVIKTIFALDPAGPLFYYENVDDRFDADDAEYTQGIRTNAGYLGFDVPLAHADFYPNWGRGQPGCGLDLTSTCAHSRAHEFFAETIRSNGFIGVHCTGGYDEVKKDRCTPGDRAPMGGDIWAPGLRGVYYLETNSNSPFAQG